jgi:chlorobactene glucosyltransferase
MYSSLKEIWEGWTKNLFAGLHYKLGLALFVCVALFLINIVPLLALPAAIAWHPDPADPLVLVASWNVFAMYAAYTAGLLVANYSPKYFWTYPLGMLVTIGLFANSARRIASGKGVSWKGRTYVNTGEGQGGSN